MGGPAGYEEAELGRELEALVTTVSVERVWAERMLRTWQARLARMQKDWEQGAAKRLADRRYRAFMDARRRLPAWEHREVVVQLVRENQVVIISGDTGCGKCLRP
jgi:HrpA-like RNA helicase